ncbi:MAG: transporter [Elusimicrobia bacterium]|nr:transporter [Elusimicrobiota bacterium]
MKPSPLFLSVLLGAAAAPAAAFHPLLTDDTGTQGRGRRQLELNGEYGADDARHGGAAAAVLTVGLNEALDAAVGLPLQYLRPHDPEAGRPRGGLSDAALELKWRVAEGRGWSLGLKPGLTLATGAEERGFGSGRATYRVAALAAAGAGRAQLLTNLGYCRNDNALGERRDLLHASLAAVVAATRRLRLAMNAAVDSSRDPAAGQAPATFVGGVLVGVTPDLDLDLGWRTGLNAAQTEDALLAGFTARF